MPSRSQRGSSGRSTQKILDDVDEFGHRALSVEFEGRSSAQDRFDGIQMSRDLRLLRWGVAVGVVGPFAHSLDQHRKWRADEHNLLEVVVEDALVLDRTR